MDQKGDSFEDDICAFDETYENGQEKPKIQMVWFNVYWYVVLHSMALYGLYLLFKITFPTLCFFLFMYVISGLGITAGAHRLWSHRSYQAKLPLQILLSIFNITAGQNSAIEWCRDHRVHHKYSETHADPHNAKRGFFFAHMGWLMCKKHPEVKSKGKNISIKDLENNPVLKFQKKFYLPLALIFGVLLPTYLPKLWGDSAWNGFFVSFILRYVLVLHATWLVNSLAHLFGNKPYDFKINPAESFPVCIFAIGEGFHNYHHTFPHDYSTSEFGMTFNPTTAFINLMAKIGWAYDLKKVSKKAIMNRKERTGDGTPNIFFPFKQKHIKVPLDEIAEDSLKEENELTYQKDIFKDDINIETLRHRPHSLNVNALLHKGTSEIRSSFSDPLLKDFTENIDELLIQQPLDLKSPVKFIDENSDTKSDSYSMLNSPLIMKSGSDILKSLGAAAKDANLGSFVDKIFSFSPTVAAESVELYARESLKAAVSRHRRSLSASLGSFENVGRGYFETTTNYLARQLSQINSESNEVLSSSLKNLNTVSKGLSSSFDCLSPGMIKIGNGF